MDFAKSFDQRHAENENYQRPYHAFNEVSTTYPLISGIAGSGPSCFPLFPLKKEQ